MTLYRISLTSKFCFLEWKSWRCSKPANQRDECFQKKLSGNGCTVRCLILFAWIPQEIDESWSELPTLFFNHDWHSSSAHNRVSPCNFLEDRNLCCFRKSTRTRFTDFFLRRTQFKTCHIAFYNQLLATHRAGWMLCYLQQVHVPIRSMALGSIQSRTEMGTRNISWGLKVARAYGWRSYHFHVPTVSKSGKPKLLLSAGTVQACIRFALPFLSFTSTYAEV